MQILNHLVGKTTQNKTSTISNSSSGTNALMVKDLGNNVDKDYIEMMIGSGRNYNFVPFMFISDLKNDFNRNFVSVFGNIALLMPFGYFILLIFKSINTLGKHTLAGFTFAFSIETIQFLISYIVRFHYRSVDIDDLILNTIGTVIGYLMLLLMISAIEKFFNITLEIKPSGERSNVQKAN